jgi:hypothetical protein
MSSEQMQRAANTIYQASDTMQHAANTIFESINKFSIESQNRIFELNEAIDRLEKLKALVVKVEGES